MYEWTEPYQDEYILERIEELRTAQKEAKEHGKLLVSTYEQFWLPVLNDLPEVEFQGSDVYLAPYGKFEPVPSAPFHGALWFTAVSGVDLPNSLKDSKDWLPAKAVLDLNLRMLKIQDTEMEITFTSINLNLSPVELLREINHELVRVNAGVYLYSITPAMQDSQVRHLYRDGKIPVLSNAHTRADVTGYAILQDRPYQHTMVYFGIVAYKTSVESLWASLIRARGGCSFQGVTVLADGEVKMLTQPLPEFNVIHAGIVCRKALPGKWEVSDDSAYALVFHQDGEVETELQALTIKRLQEALAFPVLDQWAEVLWTKGLEVGFIQRLETGGDCRGGVRIDLSKPWQDLVQTLLEQETLQI